MSKSELPPGEPKEKEKRGAAIGRRIQQRRLAMNATELGRKRGKVTLAILSEELRKHGVTASVQTLSKWELGEREDFSLREVDALAAALKCPPSALDDELFLRHGTEKELIQNIEKPNTQVMALVPFHKVGLGVDMLKQEIQKRLESGDVYWPHFQMPEGVSGFASKIEDTSMSPRMIEGRTIATFAMGVDPQPGDVILAKIGNLVLLRKFTFNDEEVVLVPENPEHRTYRYASYDDFEAKVEIIAVVVAAAHLYRKL